MSIISFVLFIFKAVIAISSIAFQTDSIGQPPSQIEPKGPVADEKLWESPWMIAGTILFIILLFFMLHWSRKFLRKRDQEK